jgi:SAM-dependent methyltransferase
MTLKTTNHDPLLQAAFPRSNRYHPDWLRAGLSGGANPLWLCEWLCQLPALAAALKPGAKVLDLGCGRGLSSVFLAAEFGVEVCAVDLWFAAEERRQRFDDSGFGAQLQALQGDVRALEQLGLAPEQFDVIISIDSFPYYGTDDTLMANLLRFLKHDGLIAIAGAGLQQELTHVPPSLRAWWSHELVSLHSADWWRQHWQRSGLLTVEAADSLPDGWRYWLAWQRVMCPDNLVELDALEADQGCTLGYVSALGRRLPIQLEAPIGEIPSTYEPHALWREKQLG